jgi:hypothetical protein
MYLHHNMVCNWQLFIFRKLFCMIRSELMQKIASENQGLKQSEVEAIVDVFFDAIIDQLAQGRAQPTHRRISACRCKTCALFQTRQRNTRPPESAIILPSA